VLKMHAYGSLNQHKFTVGKGVKYDGN